MSAYLQGFLYGIYPYICLAIFLLGSLVRFDREQYTWRSESSQLLRRGQLRWGSNLFHIGILFLFFGHLVGLLTPHSVYEVLITAQAKQLLAMISGGIAGLMCLVGLLLLIHRRLGEPRLRATSNIMDFVVLFWILATLLLGLVSIFVSSRHLDGSVMLLLSQWAQHIVTFHAGAAAVLVPAPLIYKIHLFFGMTLFLLFPFSRLVHVWSGFAALGYVTRAYQVVRSK
ncbi:MAG TPA: respiratory nitrate reductase subunit gamma [Burkholderiales bacterium]|nr:respiratory nitrate reductase subunit gamma [Burkholderiales bacterium]